MSAQHTPGPWRVVPDASHRVEVETPHRHPQSSSLGVAIESRYPIAFCYEPRSGEGAANAALIAAAPDLLALAYQYASECGECAGVGITPEDEDCAECRFIRVVINKAKGAA